MPPSLEQLIQSAEHEAKLGRWQKAEEVWREVSRLAPDHPKALYGLGFHALQRNDFTEARCYLEGAVRQAPRDLLAWMTLATVHKELRQPDAELQAIDAALVVEPYCLPALLLKAAWMERQGRAKEAAAHYGNALKIAPPKAHWPPSLALQLQRAAQVVADYQARYAGYLAERMTSIQAGLPADRQGAWREAASILSGQSRPYVSHSNQLHVPRLPALPFFERSYFPWLAELEARTDVIRSELELALSDAKSHFAPYIAYRPGDPVNQWGELNHSQRWSAFHLWQGGAPVSENLALCPRTAEILSALPLATIDGLCPNILFSALAPRTHIPPHHGETNARLVAHLPLVVPPACRLRVGFEERTWTLGETLIFDDTLEHEAFNDSDELRVVLIFDVWNPLLAQEEQSAVRAMAKAARSFMG